MAPNLNLHVDLNIVLDEEYCFEWELQRSCQCNSWFRLRAGFGFRFASESASGSDAGSASGIWVLFRVSSWIWMLAWVLILIDLRSGCVMWHLVWDSIKLYIEIYINIRIQSKTQTDMLPSIRCMPRSLLRSTCTVMLKTKSYSRPRIRKSGTTTGFRSWVNSCSHSSIG